MFFTTGGGAASLTPDYQLLPGVLHVSTAEIDGYAVAVPEPEAAALMLAGPLAISLVARRRRPDRAAALRVPRRADAASVRPAPARG